MIWKKMAFNVIPSIVLALGAPGAAWAGFVTNGDFSATTGGSDLERRTVLLSGAAGAGLFSSDRGGNGGGTGRRTVGGGATCSGGAAADAKIDSCAEGPGSVGDISLIGADRLFASPPSFGLPGGNGGGCWRPLGESDVRRGSTPVLGGSLMIVVVPPGRVVHPTG